MGTHMRFEWSGRRLTCSVAGASLIVAMVAGCKAATTADSSPATQTTAVAPVSTSVASSGVASTSKAKPTATKHHHSPTPQPSTSAQSPTAPPTAAPSTGDPQSAPSSPSMPAGSAPATDPTAPSQTGSQAPGGAVAVSATCASHASTSASGCGSFDEGASSGQAPGFAAGQQSMPNLLGINQDPWTGGQGPQVLNASSFQNWSVTATDTDPPNAPGEVLTYPNASFNYYQLNTAASGYTIPPAQYDLNNIKSLTSDFTESMPQLSDLNAEAAYDLWLNNWQTEVMVWVDTSPAKDRNLADDGMTKVGTYTYGGPELRAVARGQRDHRASTSSCLTTTRPRARSTSRRCCRPWSPWATSRPRPR